MSDGGTVRASPQGPDPGSGGCASGTVPAVLFGNQSIGAIIDDNQRGSVEAFATTAASGNVGSLSVYLDSTSTVANIVVGLYSDSGGHPGTLLSQGTTPRLTGHGIRFQWHP